MHLRFWAFAGNAHAEVPPVDHPFFAMRFQVGDAPFRGEAL
jgi:hypothetical protein